MLEHPLDDSNKVSWAKAELHDLSLHVHSLTTRLSVLHENQETLLQERAQHEETLDNIPVAHELLHSFYERSSGSLIASCEQTMTEAVQAVIGDDSVIGIDAHIRNNQIRVSIGTAHVITDGTRILRDIMDSEGGGLTNVITTSLRAIAIVRSKQRRFMVLDEPNCWLNPSQIPAFSRIIQDMVRKAGFQIILLTHHGMDDFDNDANILHLDRVEKGIRLSASYPRPTTAPNVIQAIELTNFGRHPSLYLPLQPGLNIVTGASNVGKSRILSAIRAVVCDTSTIGDILLRETHDGKDMEKSASVSITFDSGKNITWTRKKSGSPVQHWSYTIPGIEGTPEIDGISCAGKNGPSWVGHPSILNIRDIGTLNPALHGQKQAPFGIENNKSLASLVSISPTSVRLQAMLSVVSEQKTEATREIRRINARIEALSSEIHIIDQELRELSQIVNDNKRLLSDIEGLEKTINDREEILSQYNNFSIKNDYSLKAMKLGEPENALSSAKNLLTQISHQESLLSCFAAESINLELSQRLSELGIPVPTLPDLYGKDDLLFRYNNEEFEHWYYSTLAQISSVSVGNAPDIKGKEDLLTEHHAQSLAHWYHENLTQLHTDVPNLPQVDEKERTLKEFLKAKEEHRVFGILCLISTPHLSPYQTLIETTSTKSDLLQSYAEEQAGLNSDKERSISLQSRLAHGATILSALAMRLGACPHCGHLKTPSEAKHRGCHT